MRCLSVEDGAGASCAAAWRPLRRKTFQRSRRKRSRERGCSGPLWASYVPLSIIPRLKWRIFARSWRALSLIGCRRDLKPPMGFCWMCKRKGRLVPPVWRGKRNLSKIVYANAAGSDFLLQDVHQRWLHLLQHEFGCFLLCHTLHADLAISVDVDVKAAPLR